MTIVSRAEIAMILVLGLTSPLAAQTGPGDDDTLARIGDRTFSAREVDARWKSDAPADQARLLQSLYDARRTALDAVVADYLLDRAAAAAGLSREQFELAEVARRARPVTDEEVRALYRTERRGAAGPPFEEAAPLLKEFLEEQHRQAARAELVAELKGKADLRVMLDPPRRTIAIEPDDPSQGPADAPVTLVEFADFECPFCRDLAPTLSRLRAAYGERIRIVWKHFPLTTIHPQALQSAQAASCAHDQGRFWEYHDTLFANRTRLRAAALKQYARAVGLDAARFDACLDSAKFASRVEDALRAAARLGLSSTPSVFINGRIVTGAKPYEVYASIVDEELRSRARP